MSNLIAKYHVDKYADQLVQEGLVTQEQLTVAQVSQKNLGEDLGYILVKKGFIEEGKLLSFLAKTLSIPFQDLKNVQIPKEIMQRIPIHTARRYHLLPVRQEGDVVILAMADPMDRAAIEDLKALLRMEVKGVLSPMQEIDQLIERSYAAAGGRQQVQFTGSAESVEVVQDFGESTSDDKLEKIATGPQVIQIVNQTMIEAYHGKASDIHIEPRAGDLRVRYRVDGMLEERARYPKEMLLPVVSRIKILSNLDIAERRIPQDGRVRLKIGGNLLDLRISIIPTLYGEKVVIRLLSKEAGVSIESVGFTERDRKVFTELITKSHGVFLVTGPTGSGKSTTLYAGLSRINSVDKNIISVEDPIESEIPGVNQAQINTKAGVTFASALRSILRQDPDVIMIGEIRDGETAEIAVRAAITGHLVLSTLHTNTAAGAVSRLNDLGVEHFLLSSSLIGVMAQRLVRKICPKCKMEVTPDTSNLGAYASKVQKSFVGRGCHECRMTGYKGRMGIFEIFAVNDPIKKIISEKGSDKAIEEEMRNQGVPSIIDDGIDKVNQGITTLEEIFRVTQEE